MDTNYILIKDMRPGLKNINTVFIVLEVGHPTLTKENREVRTFKVADQSACINASVWDEAGQLLGPGDIVRLTKGYASLWRNCLTLYTSKLGDIQKIGEFCMVFNEQLNMSEPTSTSQPNNLPLNNGTNNGAGRIPQAPPLPVPQTPIQAAQPLINIVHNNVAASSVKTTPNATTRSFLQDSTKNQTHKSVQNRGRGNHNRNSNTRDRR